MSPEKALDFRFDLSHEYKCSIAHICEPTAIMQSYGQDTNSWLTQKLKQTGCQGTGRLSLQHLTVAVEMFTSRAVDPKILELFDALQLYT